MAIHPNGTVYVVELGHTLASRVLAIDGVTGSRQVWDLPMGAVSHYTNGVLSSAGPTAASGAGPLIREDGAVTLVARVRSGVSYSYFDGTVSWPAPGGSSTIVVH